MTIKVAARVQPVLDKAPEGQPFRPVAFQGLTATAYIEENGNFSRVAWSMRASSVSDAHTKSTARTNDKAA